MIFPTRTTSYTPVAAAVATATASIAVAPLIAFIIAAMLVPTTQSLRVAVLGSGVAGATAARTLADRGAEVTVFESGFGIGGRTSTRVTRDGGGPRYQFDHGAQYIGQPKTETFRETMEGWKSEGFVKEWSGTFAAMTTVEEGVAIEPESEAKERWVGFPRMNSICSNLLHHKNIRVKLQTRANASREDGGSGGWNLKHTKTKEDLGSFDWLVATDRNSGGSRRKDLSSANLPEFTKGIGKIQSVKSLTAMVVFEKPLRNCKLDGVQFTGTDARCGALGWVARDSSKPGRHREDGRECWVLQSHPDAANELLKGKYKIGEIREMARDVLVRDFLNCLPHLAGSGGGDDGFEIPPIVHSVGHRWGAAFPIPSQEFTDMDCQLIASEQFVACGDYFGKLSGRIEGAYLSGRSAANEILRRNDEPSPR